MGMYDEIKVEYPLPTHPEMQGSVFQTKSLDNLMDVYRITPDGELLQEKHEYGWVDDPSYPIFGGYMKSVKSWVEELSDFHGDIYFYYFAEEPPSISQPGQPPPDLITFRARFTEGKLSSLVEWSRG